MGAKKDKNSKQYLLSNLKFQYDKGDIKINPDYQRGSVWVKSQKQLLMDSLRTL